MTYYTVYKIRNKLNNKFYVGVHTTEDLHDDYMGSGLAITRAIKKYGIDSFEKEILFILESREEMFVLEKLIVDNTFINQPDIYNTNIGGFGGSWKGRKLSEETRKKMSATRLIDNWQRGKPGSNKGKFGALHHNSKAVVMVDEDTRRLIAIYGSIREAERATGIDNTYIGAACKGRNKNRLAGNYRWRYYNPWKGY